MENKNYKPTVFWAWNGDMSDSGIRKEVAELAEAGIGGLFVHARAGLTIDYLGDEWFRAYRVAVEECKKYDIDVWIYDEQGWPSGFAGGKVCALGEEYRLKSLCRETLPLSDEKMRPLAYFRERDGKTERLTDGVGADFAVGYKADEHYVDLLDAKVTDAFLQVTHEVYKRELSEEFGGTIKGIFTDEPQIHVSSLAWSFAIPEAYRARYEEDVLDRIYLLFEEGSDEAREYRFRYYSVVRGLFVHNYTRRIGEWCKKNGLIFTGHFAGEEGLCVQAASNTGVMPHYEYMSRPGIDHLGRRLNPPLLLKQVQSVAGQLGKRRILSETYGCTGNGASFRELAWIWSYQAAFGVNQPCMSIFMPRLGGVRKRDYPVFLSAQQPWWGQFSALNTFLTRASGFVSEGEREADVLLISAIDSALEEPVFSLRQRSVSACYRRLVEDLISLQISYDIGDGLLLEKYGRADEGTLCVGRGRYKLVILPRLDNISSSAASLLSDFIACGGRVVCMEALPERADGRKDCPELARLRRQPIEIIQQRRGILEKYFASLDYRRRLSVWNREGKLAHNLATGEWKTQTGENFVLFNPSCDSDKNVFVRYAGIGAFYRFDPVSGRNSPIPSVTEKEECWFSCRIAAQDAWYVRFVEGAQAETGRAGTAEVVDRLAFELEKREENLLTVDYARYRFSGGAWSEKIPTVEINAAVYSAAEAEGGGSVFVEYGFECDFSGRSVSLVGETAQAKEIFVNGRKIDPAAAEYYRDADFKKYDISGLIKKGGNVVVLEYEIPALRLGFRLNEVHDSVRNKFSYPVSIESVYILGDFDVELQGEVAQRPNCLIASGKFRLTAPREFRGMGDITSRGWWFYAGNAVYRARVKKREGRTWLRLNDYDGACAEISVNGRKAGTVFLADDETELTGFLTEEENTVSVTLFGTLRNMLGPHHHFKGEVEYTGIHTFTGEYGNGAVEDLSGAERPGSAWTDSYGFVRFGLNEATLINRK